MACGRALDFVIAANLVPNSWMPIGITAVLTIGCRGSPPAPTPSNPVYGVERWAVKTLTDADAMHVDVSNVIATTITALNSFLNTLLGRPMAGRSQKSSVSTRSLGSCRSRGMRRIGTFMLHWPI